MLLSQATTVMCYEWPAGLRKRKPRKHKLRTCVSTGEAWAGGSEKSLLCGLMAITSCVGKLSARRCWMSMAHARNRRRGSSSQQPTPIRFYRARLLISDVATFAQGTYESLLCCPTANVNDERPEQSCRRAAGFRGGESAVDSVIERLVTDAREAIARWLVTAGPGDISAPRPALVRRGHAWPGKAHLWVHDDFQADNATKRCVDQVSAHRMTPPKTAFLQNSARNLEASK